MKDTLRSKVISDVQPYLEVDGTLPRGRYIEVRNNLHTDIVSKYVNNATNNRVIGQKPPPVRYIKNHLTRIIRVTLAQLRSGFCARLPWPLCVADDSTTFLPTSTIHHLRRLTLHRRLFKWGNGLGQWAIASAQLAKFER